MIFLRLDAINGLLHVGVEILNAEAYPVESEPAQEPHVGRRDGARIDLDGVFAAVVVAQSKLTPGGIHEPAHLLAGQERRRPAAPVQLLDDAIRIEQLSLQRELLLQGRQVRDGTGSIGGDDLVAGAVVTDRAAEGDVKVERQRPGRKVLVACRGRRAIVGFAEAGVERRRRGIGRITWPAAIITGHEIRVKRQCHRRGVPGRTISGT